MNDIDNLQKQVNRINKKLTNIYREKSELKWRSEWYKTNIIKDKILEFMHQDKSEAKSHDGRIPNINIYRLNEFWRYICKNDE